MSMCKKTRHTRRAVIALLVSATLAVALLCAAALANPASSQQPTLTSEQIQQLLQAHDYTPGEAIVVAEEDMDLSAYRTEQLAQVSRNALGLTAEAAQESSEPLCLVAAGRAQASNASAYTVFLISSDTQTTEALIAELYANPKVISAEPNYISYNSTSFTEEDAQTEEEAGLDSDISYDDSYDVTPVERPNYHSEVGDLTGMQWSMNNNGTINTPEGAAQVGVDMDIPGWDEYHNNGADPNAVNSSGVIAITDSGFDLNHPDLKDVFITLTEEQQEKYGCGPHGLNASADPEDPDYLEKRGDLTDPINHGTHCAGIMAAAWNGDGVSGVANGAKILGVRLSALDGSQGAASNIRAFEFLTSIAKEINLKAVNCSWGSELGVIEFSFTLLVNKLGEQGVITVFAAANDAADLSGSISTGAYIDSPYLIVVDALNPAGQNVIFSNYSATSTDVYAPGSNIISTVPDVVFDNLNNRYMGYRYFFAENDTGILNYIDFSNEGSASSNGVEVFATNPVDDSNAQTIGEIVEGIGVNDGFLYEIGLDEFTSTAFVYPDEEESDDGIKTYQGEAYIALPVKTAAENIAYVSARFATQEETLQSADLYLMGFVANTVDGGTKVVEFAWEDASGLRNSVYNRATYHAWMPATLDVRYLLEADEEATSVYLDSEGRMIVRLDMGAFNPSFSTVCIDSIAVAGADAKAGAYTIFSGTSMAAPAVTAALAVIAKDEPQNSEVEDAGMLALKRAARLRAAVIQTPELENMCATGGYVNLAAYKDLASTEDGPLAPIITEAIPDQSEKTLQVNGYFFGDTVGTLTVDGIAVTANTWSDTTIMVSLPEDLNNGAHVVAVSTTGSEFNGLNLKGTDKAAFSSSYNNSELRLYENNLAIPNMNEGLTLAGTGGPEGALIASGDYIYVVQRDLDKYIRCLWRYQISTDTWSMCAAFPSVIHSANRGSLTATEDGILYYVQYIERDENWNTTSYHDLYDYNPKTDTWTKRDAPSDLPDSAHLFVKGDNVYFIGGALPTEFLYKGKVYTYSYEEDADNSIFDNLLLVSVLRPGADLVEVLSISSELEGDILDNLKDHSSYLFPDGIAITNDYVYFCGQEPLGGMYDLPRGLYRMQLDEDGYVTEIVNLTYEMRDAGIVQAKVYNQIAIAAMPGGIAVLGNALEEGTDTHVIAGDSTTPEPLDITSSYYEGNHQLVTWHDGKLYALGFSPSEPHHMYFRSTEYSI